jgi:biotin carboxylase
MRKNNNILILVGGGLMQIPAFDAAKRIGLRVLVLDGRSDAELAERADFFLHADISREEEVLKALNDFPHSQQVIAVFTAATDFSTTVAKIAEQFNLPGIPYEVACKAKYKHLMRQAFQEKGLSIPKFLQLSRVSELHDHPEVEQWLPVVVKPVDNMGARGIQKISSWDELGEAVRRALNFSTMNQCLVEEFVPGPEYSIDALVQDGEVHITGFALRDIAFEPFFIETGHTIPSQAPHREEIEQMFIRGVHALGISSGAAKGDMKYSTRPVIGEIAARLSGGFMSGWSYPLSSAVPLTELAIRIAMGERLSLPPVEAEGFCAERAVYSIPGILEEFDNTHEMRSRGEGKVPDELFILKKPGDQVQFPENNVQKVANILCSSLVEEEARMLAEGAVQNFYLRLQPGNKNTRDFLLGKLQSWVPDAYPGLMEYADPGFSWKFDSNQPLEQIQLRPCSIELHTDQTDWCGRTLEASLAWISRSLTVDENYPIIELGRPFVQAVQRGGYQAGLWLLETISSHWSKDYLSCETLEEILLGDI